VRGKYKVPTQIEKKHRKAGKEEETWKRKEEAQIGENNNYLQGRGHGIGPK
jgi:hypothetical protein